MSIRRALNVNLRTEQSRLAMWMDRLPPFRQAAILESFGIRDLAGLPPSKLADFYRVIRDDVESLERQAREDHAATEEQAAKEDAERAALATRRAVKQMVTRAVTEADRDAANHAAFESDVARRAEIVAARREAERLKPFRDKIEAAEARRREARDARHQLETEMDSRRDVMKAAYKERNGKPLSGPERKEAEARALAACKAWEAAHENYRAAERAYSAAHHDYALACDELRDAERRTP